MGAGIIEMPTSFLGADLLSCGALTGNTADFAVDASSGEQIRLWMILAFLDV